MMYRKAICFCDASVAAQILAADDAGEIKLLEEKFRIMMNISGTVFVRS